MLYTNKMSNYQTIQQKPTYNGSPIPDIKSAVNNINPTYGGIEVVSGSAMRQNYANRMKNLFGNTDNQKGISAGGALYVNCQYDLPDYNKRNPYRCGGPKKYKDAYGASDSICVVNLDEY